MNFNLDNFISTVSANYYASSMSIINSDSESVLYVSNLPNDSVNEDYGKYSVFEIANWFLSQKNMTHKKLQKLCYYAQAWYYAMYNKRLINTDFQAWIHGPVSPALYERFKEFGFNTIKLKSTSPFNIDEEDESFLQDIMETYGDYTGNALEALTHRELPWLEARKGYSPSEKCTVVISPSDMKSFYSSIANGD